MILVYDPDEGYAIEDGYVDDELAFLMKYLRCPAPIYYSTSNIFSAVRLAIVQGRVKPEQITFQYKDKQFYANEYGAILDWPEGFCDLEGKMAEKIIRAATQKRKLKLV